MKVEDLALQHYAAEEHGSWQGTPQPAQPLPVLLLAGSPMQGVLQGYTCTPVSGGDAACVLHSKACLTESIL